MRVRIHTYVSHPPPRPPQSRRAPVPVELANDPASITLEALECLLDMSVQGKGVVLGIDPVTGGWVRMGGVTSKPSVFAPRQGKPKPTRHHHYHH